MEPAKVGKTVRLRSLIRQIYDDKSLLPGDKFPNPVPDHVAKGLIAHRYAELDVDTKVVKEPEAEESEADSRRRKGRYSRRDLQANTADSYETKDTDAATSAPAESNG